MTVPACSTTSNTMTLHKSLRTDMVMLAKAGSWCMNSSSCSIWHKTERKREKKTSEKRRGNEHVLMCAGKTLSDFSTDLQQHFYGLFFKWSFQQANLTYMHHQGWCQFKYKQETFLSNAGMKVTRLLGFVIIFIFTIYLIYTNVLFIYGISIFLASWICAYQWLRSYKVNRETFISCSFPTDLHSASALWLRTEWPSSSVHPMEPGSVALFDSHCHYRLIHFISSTLSPYFLPLVYKKWLSTVTVF